MRLDFNPRGNGACPLCERRDACSVQRRLASDAARLESPWGDAMELVIYSCPFFAEGVAP